MGKVLYGIIANRLLEGAEKERALSNIEFGIRKGRAVDAIKVTVDIAAAIEGE